MKIINQGCTLDCFDCCKLDIHIENNEVIKIEGNKKQPYTNGIICPKGMAHKDRVNHKDRIYKPLLKVNNEWEEITFKEALNIMADKLKLYKEEYTTQSILYYTQYGNGGLLKDIGEKFMNFYGGVSHSTGGPCWSAGMKAQEYDFGVAKAHSLEDMMNSKSIIMWGKNPASTGIHTFIAAKKAKENGAKLIVIDPVYTQTAKLADIYIGIKPGSDGALALAMTKMIIDRNLHDTEYIENYVVGFKEYKEYINTLDLEKLIEECGVQKESIEELVDLYTQKYSTIYIGYGMQKYRNGGNTIRTINALGAITGQIGYIGGGINYANKVYPPVINTDPYNSEARVNNRYYKTSKISEFINESQDTDIPVKMAVITKSNLLNQLGKLNELEKSFEKIEFKVCFDMFMTDTAKACDLFIPCTHALESEDLIFSSMSNPYLTYNEKGLEPKHHLMDEYYFFMELAKVLEIENYPNVSKEEYISKVIEPLKEYDQEISIEKLKNTDFTIHNPVAWEDKIFKTPSKKIEIYSQRAKDDGLSPMPIYIGSSKSSKLRLITNHPKNSLSSQHMMDEEGISTVHINEKMIKKYNLLENEIIVLKAKESSIQTQVIIDNDIVDDTIMMYAGWWKKHGNANYIADSGISDMGGQVTYNETFVDIIKL